MNMQEQFDIMWEGLSGQNWECSLTSEGEICAYRGSGGRKCAVGHLIPDKIYEEAMESKTVSQINRKYNLGLENIEFLERAQKIHDKSESKEEMKMGFEYLAKAYGLTIPA